MIYRPFHLKLTPFYRMINEEHLDEIDEDLQNLFN